MFQYVHAMATQLAHRMHRPMLQPLHDVGFDMLPVNFNACNMLWAKSSSKIHNVLVDELLLYPTRQYFLNIWASTAMSKLSMTQ